MILNKKQITAGCLFLAVTLFSAPVKRFELKGWEYADSFTFPRQQLPDRPFLEAVSLGDSINIYYISMGRLLCLKFNNRKAFESIEKVTDLAPFSRPVIKKHNNKIYILWGRAENYYLAVQDKNKPLKIIFKGEHSSCFSLDFFIFGSRIFITLPTSHKGQYNILVHSRSLRIGPQADRSDRGLRVMEFPPPKPKDKGFFFPAIIKHKSKFHVFFMVRRPNQIKNLMEDKIMLIKCKKLQEITRKPYRDIATVGFSNRPPQIFVRSGRLYLIYTSKLRSLFRLKMMSIKHGYEHTVSGEFTNAANPLVLPLEKGMDLFFIAYSGNTSYLSNRQVRYDKKIKSLRPDGLKPLTATDPSSTMPVIKHTRFQERDHLFWFSPNLKRLMFSKNDRSVAQPRLKIRMIKMVNDDRDFPEFQWKAPQDPAGIAGYAYIIDRRRNTAPRIMNASPLERRISTLGLGPGEYWMHLSAVDQLANISKPLHVAFKIYPEKGKTGPVVTKVKKKKPVYVKITKRKKSTVKIAQPVKDDLPNHSVLAFIKYQGYIKSAHAALESGEHSHARRYLNRASLIFPQGADLYALTIRLNTSGRLTAYHARKPLPLLGIVLAMIWAALFVSFVRVNRV